MIKKVLDVLSKNDVALLLTRISLDAAAQEFEFSVPLVYVLPAWSQRLRTNCAPLSLVKAPVVSAGNNNFTLVQLLVTLNVFDICLLFVLS